MTTITLGPEGTFSHELAQKRMGCTDIRFVPTIHSIITAVARGEGDGIAPIENSEAGGVGETLDGLSRYPVYITGEMYMPIHHHLASQVPLEQIEVIYAHPQTHEQCSNLLESWQIPVIHTTQQCGERTRKQEKSRRPARSSRPSQRTVYDVPIILRHMENNHANTTRFVRLSRSPGPGTPAEKCSILIDPSTDRAGLLHDLLDVFAQRRINLTGSSPGRRNAGSATTSSSSTTRSPPMHRKPSQNSRPSRPSRNSAATGKSGSRNDRHPPEDRRGGRCRDRTPVQELHPPGPHRRCTRGRHYGALKPALCRRYPAHDQSAPGARRPGNTYERNGSKSRAVTGQLPCDHEATLDLNNSGTSLRLLASLALLCRVPGCPHRQRTDAGTADRPARTGPAVARGPRRIPEKRGLPPAEGERPPDGGRVTIDGSMSSQFISSILLAAPYATDDVEVVIPSPPASQSYLDITLDVMKAFGATRRTGKDMPGSG